jgi:hypothetical protein
MGRKPLTFRNAHPQRYAIVGDGVTFGVRPVNGKPSAHVNIGPLLLDRVGWQRGTEVTIQWGAGDDFGKARLELGTPGFKLRPFGKRALSLGVSTTNLPPGANDDYHQAEYCAVRITKTKAVELTLPTWFFKRFEADAFE